MIRAHFKNIRTELLKEISLSQKTLKIAMAWFTNNELFDALIAKCKDKVRVELIIINDSINIKKFGLDFNQFIKEGGILYFGDIDSLMHHKFCIIDNHVLINGSYNWTYWAESRNNENITVINNEPNILDEFTEEFKKLVSFKSPIKIIDDAMINLKEDENSFFNLKNIRINEYISSAIDIGERGNAERSAEIFKEINDLNPRKVSQIIQSGVASNNPLFQKIYKSLSINTFVQEATTYENSCNKIYYYIKEGDYINAINNANACAIEFPNKFSVHVYCGDAKMALNDKEGAYIEYHKAINYHHSNGSKLLYYGKYYNYPYFPKADIYMKLGDKQKMVEMLQEAFRVYSQLKIIRGMTSAENYLKQISNNETIPIIR
jgi:phosphatidylserine/phosphatidylglycerophosphate/cardiolipin synthase-like enzyme